METVTIKNLKDFEGQEIKINGWVYNRRSIGKVWFLILRDGTGLLQCVVVDGECDLESFQLEQNLNQEDSVSVTGVVKKEPRAVGGFELGVKNIKIAGNLKYFGEKKTKVNSDVKKIIRDRKIFSMQKILP